MILELDCGNSFIKWRVLEPNARLVLGGGVVDSDLALLADLQVIEGLALKHCRLVSVRTSEETGVLISLLKESFEVSVVCATPAREMSGVRNGYEEFERLGLDRWLALLGGFHLPRAALPCIGFRYCSHGRLRCGDGEHLGGFICPGMPLMRNQLRTHTRKIRYGDLQLNVHWNLDPGRTTVEAVERGCLLMLRGFVLTQLEIGSGSLGGRFRGLPHGGDAGLVSEIVPEAKVVPDLVFVGLAMACPLA